MTTTLALVHHREHDLPPKWDGLPVTWSEDAIPLGGVFICPPPKPRFCPACGQHEMDGTDTYVGKVSGDPEPPYWTRDRVTERPRKHRGWETLHAKLFLRRCLGCGHDQVDDLDTGECWDLDESDYGDDGSVAPTDPQGALF